MATRSGAVSSTSAACKSGASPPAPAGSSSHAAVAAAKRPPLVAGRVAGAPVGGAQAQAPPLAGWVPGHVRMWPERDTTVRPAPEPQEAPSNGGSCERPLRAKGCAAKVLRARGRPTCATAPKPRGVSAATKLPPPCSAGPQARSWGSKKLGHETGSGAEAPGAWRASAATSPSTAAEKPSTARLPSASPVPPPMLSRRAPSVSFSALRFSSCHAICSGSHGFAPAGHGKPYGVPSSCGSSERRVMGGRDQCGAVISACSPSTTSTTHPPMRKIHEMARQSTMLETSLQGSTCCVALKTGTALEAW
mmetsp:Transcript_71242/g.164737  ORF Transcript_71242/g.164737 Transcript_71242/m.164737 type:complete len:306 (+) Transcript_71242:804-1721(+)